MQFILRLEPQFGAPMPPPAYIARYESFPSINTYKSSTMGIFAHGNWYPGIYDATITAQYGMSGHCDTIYNYQQLGSFRIKNFIRVTGSGVSQ